MKKTKKGDSTEDYRSVPYDPDAFAELRKGEDPLFRKAFEDLNDEFEALDVLLAARKTAGLTQAEVAARMGLHQSALARIEANLGNRKHSPSMATLRKYARACGGDLKLRIEIPFV